MAIAPISGTGGSTSGIDPAQTLALNNNQITAMLLNKNLDPQFATLLLNQMTTNNVNSILFGDQNQQQNTDIFGTQGLVPDNLAGTASMNNTDIYGGGAFGSVSPQFQMSVYSTLIGKTVNAIEPMTQQQIEGVVKSVSYLNGKVVVEINEKSIPTENIIRIK